jgi:hypothetical protein
MTGAPSGGFATRTLVTRWLKVYVLMDLRSRALLRVLITIRGEAQE